MIPIDRKPVVIRIDGVLNDADGKVSAQISGLMQAYEKLANMGGLAADALKNLQVPLAGLQPMLDALERQQRLDDAEVLRNMSSFKTLGGAGQKNFVRSVSVHTSKIDITGMGDTDRKYMPGKSTIEILVEHATNEFVQGMIEALVNFEEVVFPTHPDMADLVIQITDVRPYGGVIGARTVTLRGLIVRTVRDE